MTMEAERQNQAVIAYGLLKRDITSGQFRPGDKLLMSHLKERYQIGAGPMREALSQLVAERMVTAASQRGFRVAKMSLQELNDIYDARAHLEAMIVRLAVERGDEHWEAEVIGKAHTLASVAALHSTDEMMNLWDKRHKEFHTAIARGCGSSKLLELRATLMDQAERYRQLWLRQTVFSTEALVNKRREHAAIVEALLERDAQRAGTLMLDHLLTPVPIITAIVREAKLAEE
ncbi:DNA-binding transcriptional regulator CsiR [Marinobacterium sedimentorum]|uniref:DNA-binding transcriptional regulator CsiR n=1 Tax=Marinobacterium sedimentorum TaxID=2927804 RepID=UPI0020C6D2C2|nr:DNA-binding transcriptional regulator CsiR [Marinobacterium sedimentorum]MCP8687181.1 DNA-binding transcriptional regulator CsiR [Marinobacterium sedimentorum]